MNAAGAGAGGGSSLSEVYQNARRLLLRTRDGFARLERLESSSFSSAAASSLSSTPLVLGLDSPELSFSIKRDIAQIQSLCTDMDHLWRSIAAKGQRDLWKRKIEQVAEEVDSLKESLEKLLIRQQKRMMEAKERAELFQRANGESEHVLRIFDEEAQAIQSARKSSMMLEEAYDTGVAVLSKYAEQRDRLKRAQRKALDVLNTVGLSNSVLKLIERRHRVDKSERGFSLSPRDHAHAPILTCAVLLKRDAIECDSLFYRSYITLKSNQLVISGIDSSAAITLQVVKLLALLLAGDKGMFYCAGFVKRVCNI
ncbi:hypothetical protein J5N97_009198 [Dioscorea zingiberensis]|uniref:Membrin n=1 Tax=Dioscorea zingiberensis TaxID=325984 RepID=A0A9D5HLK1_9LILI|nr:hypothetical protein J5N97_009198 [Dioscorea zingiberensis]